MFIEYSFMIKEKLFDFMLIDQIVSDIYQAFICVQKIHNWIKMNKHQQLC